MEPLCVGKQRFYVGDARDILKQLPAQSVDVVVTSPPYNLGKKYGVYNDNQLRGSYMQDLRYCFSQIAMLLRPKGSFFLNMGFSSKDPWVAMDVAQCARHDFLLQNHFSWVKSITLDSWAAPGLYDGIARTYGHFQPVNSPRYVNQAWEHVFHFTLDGNVPVDRLALGVPYEDKSNLKRGTRGKNGDLRCRGNTWFVPYSTVQSKGEKGAHPAVFPEQLVEWCVKLHGLRPELVVLDPFVGTGTTLAVCEQLGIRGIGIDVDPSYVAWAADRVRGLKG